MKKIITIFLISFLFLNTTFASLNIIQETKIKTQVEKAYLSFEKKLSKLEIKTQIKKINTITGKIDILQKKKLSDKNKVVLSHLNDLLKARKVVLEWGDNIKENDIVIDSNKDTINIGNDTNTVDNVVKDKINDIPQVIKPIDSVTIKEILKTNPELNVNIDLINNNYTDPKNALYDQKSEADLIKFAKIVNKSKFAYITDPFLFNQQMDIYIKDVIIPASKVNGKTLKPYTRTKEGANDGAISIEMWQKIRELEPKYNDDISDIEQKELNWLLPKIFNLKAESIKSLKASNLASGVEGYKLMEQFEKQKENMNMLISKYVMLVSKKWEIKNICAATTTAWLSIRDRETYEQIWYWSTIEWNQLYEEFLTAWYFWFSMRCDDFMLYPELKTPISKLLTMSKLELENLLNNDSFIPTEANTKNMNHLISINWFPWYNPYKDYTKLEYAKELSKIMKKNKELHIIPFIRLKQWYKWDDIYKWLSPVYSFMYPDIFKEY